MKMSFFPHRRLVGALLFVALPQFSLAEEAAPVAEAPETDLRSSVIMALGANYLVRVDTLAVEQADARVSGAWGAYDPALTAETVRFRQAAKDGTYLQGEGRYSNVGVELAAPTGTSASMKAYDYGLKDIPAGQDSHFTGVYLGIRQNLLRGFGVGPNMAPIRVASKKAAISREVFREEVSQLVENVQFAYFDALLAAEYARVAEESCFLAEKLCGENEKRAAIGSMAGSDLFQAKAELAARRESLYEARRSYGDARNALRLLMAGDAAALKTMDFTLAALPDPEAVTVDPKADYALALSLRPDYRKAVLGLERDQIDALRASNNALPDLQAFAGLYMQGSGDSLSRSYSNARDVEKKDFEAGFTFRYSVPNRAGWAEKAVARRQAKIARLTLRQLEMEIFVSLDDGARRIECDWQRLATARESRELAEQSLDAEQKLYDAGKSSTFVILRLQTDLMNARLREYVAGCDYRKSVVEYRRLCGTILDGWNIVTP